MPKPRAGLEPNPNPILDLANRHANRRRPNGHRQNERHQNEGRQK
jgi:hypothetical protein